MGSTVLVDGGPNDHQPEVPPNHHLVVVLVKHNTISRELLGKDLLLSEDINSELISEGQNSGIDEASDSGL